MKPIVLLSKTDKKGVTLVEVLIAMTILLIVFMGLIQASVLAIGANMRNEIRDEAVNLTSGLMTQLRIAPFDDLDGNATLARGDVPMAVAPSNPDPANFTVNPALTSRVIRNVTVPYTVTVTVVLLDADHKQITIATSWAWQGEAITPHTIVAYRGRS